MTISLRAGKVAWVFAPLLGILMLAYLLYGNFKIGQRATDHSIQSQIDAVGAIR